MKTYSVLIRQVSPFGQELSHRGLSLPAGCGSTWSVLPGFCTGTAQILPVSLFPCGELPDGLNLCGKSPPFWQTGDTLLLQGPCGQGFIESLKVRKLAIHAVEPALESRLHLVAVQALQRGADVAWVSDNLSVELPPQVEVLKSTDFMDAVAWSDACAVALLIGRIADFQHSNPFKPGETAKVEVLLDTPLICGNSHCGVCAVETTKGWKLACKDGPVFRLEDLPRE